jgi:glycerate kinase
MEAVAEAMNGRWVSCPAVDALGRGIESRYVLADVGGGPIAVLEMAETAGMWRLGKDERNPLVATTRGVGIQMVHAVRNHAVVRIILGLGGSVTNDGGCGMAAELGIGFLDHEGRVLDPQPSQLGLIHSVDFQNRIKLPGVTAACDVDNPLLGTKGATSIFSAQKGATEEMKMALEEALAHLVMVSGGEEAAVTPGAGAAGGLGFGLLHFAAAELVSGFDLLAGVLDLESRIQIADHVVTGEGSIDHQSLSGKGPVALARLARSQGIPVTGFCGVADLEARESGVFDGLHVLADSGLPVEVLLERAASLLTELVVKSDFLKS